MPQNRNKLIELFIANIYNAVVHNILEKATFKQELIIKYDKELLNSLEIAKKYREKINPSKSILPYKDVFYIKNKIMSKVRAELMLRINKGYENIDLSLIEPLTDKFLKEVKVV